MDFVGHDGITVNRDFLVLLKAHNLAGFEALMNLSGGTVIKKRRERSVVRIELPGTAHPGGKNGGKKRCFYLKRHYSCAARGVRRLFPSMGASEDGKNEWEKILLLREFGFPTVVPAAFGEKGKESLVLTEEIYEGVRVEDYIPTLSSDIMGFEGVLKKRALIRKVAAFARKFHEKGFYHQDFYLGHFFIRPESGELFILDVQRVQRMENLKERWIVKDLSQIAFSAKNTVNFSSTDLVRFGHEYLGKEKFSEGDKKAIRKILSKSRRIARHTVKLLERRRKAAR
ncbi:MAG: hypothetical protein HY883_02320 [Deltaproteobacteria bacterium]|nr:hypothetical protein [Deltaproteobacteria bacterium]